MIVLFYELRIFIIICDSNHESSRPVLYNENEDAIKAFEGFNNLTEE